jgi:hypothetical protein
LVSDHPARMQNRDAPILYAIVGGGLGLALVAGMFTPQRIQVLAFVVVLVVLMARYLLPTSVTVDTRELRFRWPLRQVTVTTDNLASAKVLRGAVGNTVGLRCRHTIRWGVIVDRYEQPQLLARILSELVEASTQLPEPMRREVVTLLRKRR